MNKCTSYALLINFRRFSNWQNSINDLIKTRTQEPLQLILATSVEKDYSHQTRSNTQTILLIEILPWYCWRKEWQGNVGILFIFIFLEASFILIHPRFKIMFPSDETKLKKKWHCEQIDQIQPFTWWRVFAFRIGIRPLGMLMTIMVNSHLRFFRHEIVCEIFFCIVIGLGWTISGVNAPIWCNVTHYYVNSSHNSSRIKNLRCELTLTGQLT